MPIVFAEKTLQKKFLFYIWLIHSVDWIRDGAFCYNNKATYKQKFNMEIIYQKQAEKGKQCQDCQSFIPKENDSAGGTCFGKDVLAEGGCMFFKKKEAQQ